MSSPEKPSPQAAENPAPANQGSEQTERDLADNNGCFYAWALAQRLFRWAKNKLGLDEQYIQF